MGRIGSNAHSLIQKLPQALPRQHVRAHSSCLTFAAGGCDMEAFHFPKPKDWGWSAIPRSSQLISVASRPWC